jgi:ribonuclease R
LDNIIKEKRLARHKHRRHSSSGHNKQHWHDPHAPSAPQAHQPPHAPKAKEKPPKKAHAIKRFFASFGKKEAAPVEKPVWNSPTGHSAQGHSTQGSSNQGPSTQGHASQDRHGHGKRGPKKRFGRTGSGKIIPTPGRFSSPAGKGSSRHKNRFGSGRSGSSGVKGREVVGTVQAHEKGFGFFVPEDGSPDAFLPPHEMRSILNGDKVKAEIFPDPRQPERFNAHFIEMVERKNRTLVGVLSKQKGLFVLRPDDPKLPAEVPVEMTHMKAEIGQKAVLEITHWPPHHPLKGRLIEILGFAADPGVEIKSVIRKHQWPESFSKSVESEAHRYPADPGEEDFKDRLDLRKLLTLTIDGADAKDYDDAISLEKRPNGHMRLGVHIADVSHYVTPDSPIDKEGKARATSLYLTDRVLPMLPHSLSDGLCSLREDVPRLAMTAFMDYDPQGHVVKTEFSPSVIQSARRGIYKEVQEVLDGTAPPELERKYVRLKPMLFEMRDLSRQIRKHRGEKGALDFDFPEVKAVMDAEGRVVGVIRLERLETHRMIEDFMVSANEAVATFLWEKKIPAMYRIHEPPSPMDLEDLIAFLRAYHIAHKHLDLSSPKGLQDLLTSMKGEPLEPVVSVLALRSLKLAVYSTQNLGHFGLGLDSYCHFTSPIRRYPDLVVHRSLKKALGAPGGVAKGDGMAAQASHCSLQERAAEKAERECQKLLQLRFMEDKVGLSFTGIFRHVTSYGAYLEIQPFGVEGFLPLEKLGQGYRYDAQGLCLSTESGTHLRLGDSMIVKIHSIDRIFQRMLLEPSLG